MTDHLPPHDLAAEQSLLGSVLLGSDVADKALLSLPPDAFWHPRHQVLAAVLTTRLHRGEGVDPTLVLADLAGRSGAGRDGSGRDLDGSYLLQLVELAWSPGHADHYAQRLRQLAAVRRLLAHMSRAGQQLAALDPDDLRVVVDVLRRGCGDVEDALHDGIGAPSQTLTDLLAQPVEHDWLVPGLLERAERILLTGGEGHGKSYLTAQLACCLAAGLHPFTGAVLGAGRRHLSVLVVDAENSRNQTHRRYSRIAKLVDASAPHMHWRDNIRLEFRPEGLDLLGRDIAWTERTVASNAPDLLVIGPLYKLHRANINDETAARDLLYFLDSIRTRYGCALLTESHPGHAENIRGERKMRPAGSSLFLRWPEFGYGLARAKHASGEHPEVVDVVAWRGSREERHWPKQLQHGKGYGCLPWVPSDVSYGADAEYTEETA